MRKAYSEAGVDARLTKVFASEWTGPNDPDWADYGTKLEYDFAGRLTRTSHETHLLHDLDPTTWTDLGAREVERKVNVGTAIAGNSVTQTQVTTRETYDGFGRLVKVEEPLGDGLSSLVPTSYHYDESSRLIGSMTKPLDATPDQQRCWTYDPRGLLGSERQPELGASGQGSTIFSEYDALGNARQKTTGSRVVSFLFDRANRLETVSEGPLASPTRALKAFSYGISSAGGDWALGKVQTANAWNYLPTGANPEPETRLEETFVYGGVGGRKSERTLRLFLGAGALEAFHAPRADLQAFHHSEGYDALGQLVSLSYPQCLLGTYECLTPGAQLPVRSQDWRYELGRLRQVEDWTLADGITYHRGGMWAEIRHANGVTDVQGRDGEFRPRPASLSTVLGSKVLWQPGAFTYDAAGNILSLGPSEDGGTDLFAYDGVSRLRASRFFVQQRNPLDTDLLVDSLESGDLSLWNRTQHWESSATLAYVFDEHGNLLKEQRNGADVHLHLTDGATNRLTEGSAYDAAGNQTLYDNVTTTFDALNRVVKRQASGGTPLYFLYTADDERTVTWDSEGSHPVYLRFTLRDFDGKLIRKVNETSSRTLVADEDTIFRGDQPLAKVGSADGFAGFHLSLDHLGSVRLTTNGSGTIVAKKKFYPFGEEATPFFEQAAIALKYTGHERDAYDPAATADDRDYMHARFASPITGRFLSVDPVVVARRATRMPQAWNRYAYVAGNPLKLVDPTGRSIELGTDLSQAQEDLEKMRGIAGAGGRHLKLLSKKRSFLGIFNWTSYSVGTSNAVALASSGNVGRALGQWIASNQVLDFRWGTSSQTASGGGAYTDVRPGSGATINIDPQAVGGPEIGGVGPSVSSAIVHELGHSLYALNPGLVAASAAGRYGTVDPMGFLLRSDPAKIEGFPLAFENSWRPADQQRPNWIDRGDYTPPTTLPEPLW